MIEFEARCHGARRRIDSSVFLDIFFTEDIRSGGLVAEEPTDIHFLAPSNDRFRELRDLLKEKMPPIGRLL